MNVIPSGLSLVTEFSTKDLALELRQTYSLDIKRLYNALVTLLIRFHHDWVSDNIDKSKVLIIRYDKMMSNFEIIMNDIFSFLDLFHQKINNDIQKTAEKQRTYKSKHKYDLKNLDCQRKKLKRLSCNL